jgi:CubicO group peptidase (beta-lactamase class C family)
MVDTGALDLDRPVSDTLGESSSGGSLHFTPRMLLAHTSGLPAWQPYFQMLRKVPMSERQSVLKEILLQETLVYPPGAETRYSDVGFLQLAFLMEDLSGEFIPALLENTIYPEIGGEGLYFQRLQDFREKKYAAGQLCPWRRRLLRGIVDDETAFSLGDAAGHAGLFGSAAAVHRVISALWRAYVGASRFESFSQETVRSFLTPPSDGTRALGFDVPSGEQPACGRFFQGPTVGHLGFTGVSFWLELDTGIHIVFLTNRTHPFRFRQGITRHRPLIHDAIMGVLSA